MKKLAFTIAVLALVGCGGPSEATRQGAHDLAHELPGIFRRHDPSEERAACRLASAIDGALNPTPTAQ